MTRKLRVLHVAYSSQPDVTGASIRTRYIVETQARLGLVPIVLSSPFQRPTKAECAQGIEVLNGIPHYRCFQDRDYGTFMDANKSLALRARKLLEMLPFAVRIREVAKAEGVDVIHAHSLFFCGLAAALAARTLGLPCVYEVRSLTEECLVDQGGTSRRGGIYWLYRSLDALAFKLASHVVTISDGLRQELIRRHVPESRITVVGNGVDVARQSACGRRDAGLMRAVGLPADAFVLGYIGTLFTYESLDLLLEAVSRIRQRAPDVHVMIVGEGDATDQLRSLSTSLGLDDRVRFVGRVPHDEVGRYYDLVDLFVLPRRRSRLTDLVTPLKPLEIMARGKPVLASNCGGHLELIEEGVNGYLFDAGTAETLANRIEELRREPEAMTQRALSARTWVTVNRSWEAMVSPTLDLYARLVGVSGSRQEPNSEATLSRVGAGTSATRTD